MRSVNWNIISDDIGLALITVPDFSWTGDVFLADFNDTKALAYKKTKHFLGLSKHRGVRLGGHPLRMVDGVWYITEDLEISETIQDVQISCETLSLQLIR